MIALKLLLSVGIIVASLANNKDGELLLKGVFSGGIFEKLLALLNNVTPNSKLGERLEFKELALGDHVNDDLLHSSTQEIIEAAGFRSTTHRVITSDGYITELINIINPLADQSQLKRPPVVMFHGATIDSTCFVWAAIRQHHPEKYPRNYYEDGPITSSNRSIAFVLANNGYDVWLAHSRGSNKHNIGHTRYQAKLLEDLLEEMGGLKSGNHGRMIADTLKYFEYSQDELVDIEYPAQIDKVLQLTGCERVSVVTYSKSSQIVFKLLASDTVHARRIHSHATIGPCLNFNGASNLFKLLSRLAMRVPSKVGNLLFTQIITSTWARELLANLDRYTIVWIFSTLLGGPSPRYQSNLELPVIGHLGMPISFPEIKHFFQQTKKGKLQKYDYGPVKNMMVYNGSMTPPEYDVSEIKLKRWMMVSGETDTLATPDSAKRYYKMHRSKPYKWIKFHKGNHVDLAVGFENDVVVNLPILEFMDKFQITSADTFEW